MFCTGLTKASKAGQKSILPAQRAQRTNHWKTPFICSYSKSPLLSLFPLPSWAGRRTGPVFYFLRPLWCCLPMHWCKLMGRGGWKHVPIRSAIKIERGGMSKLKDTLRFGQPVCYFKTRIKYDYCTVRNAHLSLIGNLSNYSGRKSTKMFGEKIREIYTRQSQQRRPRVMGSAYIQRSVTWQTFYLDFIGLLLAQGICDIVCSVCIYVHGIWSLLGVGSMYNT